MTNLQIFQTGAPLPLKPAVCNHKPGFYSNQTWIMWRKQRISLTLIIFLDWNSSLVDDWSEYVKFWSCTPHQDFMMFTKNVNWLNIAGYIFSCWCWIFYTKLWDIFAAFMAKFEELFKELFKSYICGENPTEQWQTAVWSLFKDFFGMLEFLHSFIATFAGSSMLCL